MFVEMLFVASVVVKRPIYVFDSKLCTSWGIKRHFLNDSPSDDRTGD